MFHHLLMSWYWCPLSLVHLKRHFFAKRVVLGGLGVYLGRIKFICGSIVSPDLAIGPFVIIFTLVELERKRLSLLLDSSLLLFPILLKYVFKLGQVETWLLLRNTLNFSSQIIDHDVQIEPE